MPQRYQFEMQLYPLRPRVAAIEQRSSLAYTGSSAAQCRPSPGAPAPPGQPSNALGRRENPPPFSHSICGKARPKTSVAVDAARGDAHTPAQPRTLAIATVRRQRASTVAAGTTNSPTKGAAA